MFCLQVWDLDEATPFLEVPLDTEPGDGSTTKLGENGTEELSSSAVEIVN